MVEGYGTTFRETKIITATAPTAIAKVKKIREEDIPPRPPRIGIMSIIGSVLRS
jgi:hypothetical protein